MSDIKIPDLPETVELQDDDLFPVETANGTRKLKKKNLITNTTVDPTPTEGSDNPVSSGGVYDVLQDKQDAPITLENILRIGENEIDFIDDIFSTEDVSLSFFTDNKNTIITEVEIDTNTKTLTLYVEPMDVDVVIRVCVTSI